MRNAVVTLFGFVLLGSLLSEVSIAADWLTLPSTYTHDPVSYQRTSQYTAIAAPTAVAVSDYETSGYTHVRSSLNYGQSQDNYHRVRTWGPPVRPYGEWQFPYRPYSVPYQAWGAPFAGLNIGPQFFGNGLPGNGLPGNGLPGNGRPGNGLPGNGHFPGGQRPNQ